MKITTVLTIVFAAFALPMTSVQAATCPDPVTAGSGYVTLTTTPESSCFTQGTGGVDLSPLILLDKTTETDDLLEGALTINETSTGQGDFSISAALTAGYTDLKLVIKDGTLSQGLQWGAFSLAALSGTWALQDADGKFKGLSGAELWGSVSPIPVPAAVWLFGTALLGFVGMSRRIKV